MILIDRDLGYPVLGQTDQPGVTIGGEIHPAQVLFDRLGEHPLVIADHDQLAVDLR
jgi:hypothetical protein